MKLLIIVMSLLLTLPSFAGKASSNEVEGLSNSSITLASINRVETLVQSQKGDSDLRVSLLVENEGGSTDVSPKASLYLTTFNVSEMRDAQSVHLIKKINKLISFKRIDAGIYEAVVSLYDFDSKCPEWNGNISGEMKITIDAQKLTADVRNFKGVGEFERGTVTTPIYTEYTCL